MASAQFSGPHKGTYEILLLVCSNLMSILYRYEVFNVE